MIKATKNNGKGKRPSEVQITLEGRNAYGTRHVSVLVSDRDGKGTYNLLNIDIEGMKELVDQLQGAFKVAKTIEDTTPAKYRTVENATKVAGLDASTLLALLGQLGIQIPTQAAPAPVKAKETPVLNPTDDLEAISLASILEVITKAGKVKGSRKK